LRRPPGAFPQKKKETREDGLGSFLTVACQDMSFRNVYLLSIRVHTVILCLVMCTRGTALKTIYLTQVCINVPKVIRPTKRHFSGLKGFVVFPFHLSNVTGMRGL
jgi:hypothetical protein